MSLDALWKFVRFLLRRKIIDSHEARELMIRIIEKRIKLNEPVNDGYGNLFDNNEETPF